MEVEKLMVLLGLGELVGVVVGGLEKMERRTMLTTKIEIPGLALLEYLLCAEVLLFCLCMLLLIL
jgi:hypothetical protein